MLAYLGAACEVERIAMGSFADFIELTPEWEKLFSPEQTAMLVSVSKATAAAVRRIVPAKLPYAFWLAPSQVAGDQGVRWNRLWCATLAEYPFERWMYLVEEDDALQIAEVYRNISGALDYMPNVRMLDMSRGPELQPVLMWSVEECTAFAPLLAQKCVRLRELRLGAAMLEMVRGAWMDAEHWRWLRDLPQLHTLALEGVGLSSTTGGDVLRVAMTSTSLTRLSMDHNVIGDLSAILDAEGGEEFRLQDLSLGYCGSVWPTARALSPVPPEAVQKRSADALTQLMTQYTSLTKLNLRGNEYSDRHGQTIAKALRTVTNLTHLDLLEHNMSFEVQDEIRAAWNADPGRSGDGIIIDTADLPNFQWKILFPPSFAAAGGAATGDAE